MKRIRDVITEVFDEKIMEKAEGYSVFFSCWKDLTEKNGIPSAVAHSWIKSLENGLVWIEVDHPGWKQIVQTKERKLLYDFRYRFPDMGISGISIVLCRPGTRLENIKNKPIAETASVKTEKEQPLAISTDDVPIATDTQAPNFSSGYDDIKNVDLKKLLMRLEKSVAERNS
ncbi:MAG: DUF721 domain-containing protein [Treponema sp.]|nr:DUF721 domain-containing protein [Treponema sp.]